MENGKRYKLAVGDDGELTCIDAKTGREVGLGRCIRIALDEDKGVRVAFNKRLCELDESAQRKLVERVKRGEETVWAYEEPPPRLTKAAKKEAKNAAREAARQRGQAVQQVQGEAEAEAQVGRP